LFPYFKEMEIKNPLKIPKIYNCEICDFHTSYKNAIENHFLTIKHKKMVLETNGNEKSPNSDNVYYCDLCKYTTLKKKDYSKHELTTKHKNAVIIANSNNNSQTIYGNITKEEIIADSNNRCYYCNKQFANKSGLWKHKKKCNIEETDIIIKQNNKNEVTSDIFAEFMKQSTVLQQFFIEQNKDLQHTLLEKTNEFQNTIIEQNNKIIELSKNQQPIVNTNLHNTTNNHFNLNLFLNETCKDAMNIMDFVNSLQLKVEDFEATGRLGYIEGISRIIVNSMKDMDIEKRPMHCTDFKRETLYIKDQNIWAKENPDKNKFKKAVKHVAQLNLSQLPKWQEKNPECLNINTPKNDEFIKLSLAALGSRTPEEEEKFVDKIMKNVLKEIVVDKKI